MGVRGQIEVLKDGRRHRRYRTPRAVLRALELVDGRDVEQFTEEQILEWINAAAPLAASRLIKQLRSNDESISQHAAIKVLEWAAGRPRAAKDDSNGRQPFPLLPGRRVEIIITDPEGKASGDGDFIDAGTAEGGPALDQPSQV